MRPGPDLDEQEDKCVGAGVKLTAAGLIILGACAGILTLFVMAIIWAWRHV